MWFNRFFLNSKLNEQKGSVYQSFCQLREKKLEDCLEEDLTLCQEVDTNLLCWLVPGVFEQYAATACDNPSLIHVIISTVDSVQLQQLITSILLGKLLSSF